MHMCRRGTSRLDDSGALCADHIGVQLDAAAALAVMQHRQVMMRRRRFLIGLVRVKSVCLQGRDHIGRALGRN